MSPNRAPATGTKTKIKDEPMKLKPITRNDASTLHFLKTCNREIQVVTDHRHPLPDLFKAQVADQLASFSKASEDLLQTRARLKTIREEIGEKETDLQNLLRHVFQNVRRKKNKPDFPPGLLLLFGLDDQGRLGRIKVQLAKPTLVAAKALEANDQAIEQGYHFMIDPSQQTIVNLKAKLECLYVERHDLLDQQREQHQIMTFERFKAETLFITIRGYLWSTLRGYEKSYRRDILRGYGFTYQPSKPEPQPEESDPQQETAA
jgi:hypothetical protein